MLLRWILSRVLRNYSGEQLEDLAYDYITKQDIDRREALWSAIFRLGLRDPKRKARNKVLYAQLKKFYETESENN
jgi:hypothetical protein